MMDELIGWLGRVLEKFFAFVERVLKALGAG